MKQLETLELIPKEYRDLRFEYCLWTLPLIGMGTGRAVFELSDELVIKIALNDAGLAQNKVEATTKPNDLLANIYRHSDDFEWCIMEKVIPMCHSNALDGYSGTTQEDRVTWWEYKALEWGWFEGNDVALHHVEARYDKCIEKYGDEWVEEMMDNKFNNDVLDLIFENRLEVGDICRYGSWGIKGSERNPVLLDYGLNNDVWNNNYERIKAKIKIGGEVFDCLQVFVKDEPKKSFIPVMLNDKPTIGELIFD